MLVDQVTAKICIPKIVFNISNARKMKSDEFFLYHTVCFLSNQLSLLTLAVVVVLSAVHYQINNRG